MRVSCTCASLDCFFFLCLLWSCTWPKNSLYMWRLLPLHFPRVLCSWARGLGCWADQGHNAREAHGRGCGAHRVFTALWIWLLRNRPWRALDADRLDCRSFGRNAWTLLGACASVKATLLASSDVPLSSSLFWRLSRWSRNSPACPPTLPQLPLPGPCSFPYVAMLLIVQLCFWPYHCAHAPVSVATSFESFTRTKCDSQCRSLALLSCPHLHANKACPRTSSRSMLLGYVNTRPPKERLALYLHTSSAGYPLQGTPQGGAVGLMSTAPRATSWWRTRPERHVPTGGLPAAGLPLTPNCPEAPPPHSDPQGGTVFAFAAAQPVSQTDSRAHPQTRRPQRSAAPRLGRSFPVPARRVVRALAEGTVGQPRVSRDARTNVTKTASRTRGRTGVPFGGRPNGSDSRSPSRSRTEQRTGETPVRNSRCQALTVTLAVVRRSRWYIGDLS